MRAFVHEKKKIVLTYPRQRTFVTLHSPPLLARLDRIYQEQQESKSLQFQNLHKTRLFSNNSLSSNFDSGNEVECELGGCHFSCDRD